MKRYFIDTCVLKWLIEDHKRIKDIANDIKYYQGDFAISIVVLQEFANLLAAGKIKIKFNDEKLISTLKTFGIEICNFEKKTFKVSL